MSSENSNDVQAAIQDTSQLPPQISSVLTPEQEAEQCTNYFRHQVAYWGDLLTRYEAGDRTMFDDEPSETASAPAEEVEIPPLGDDLQDTMTAVFDKLKDLDKKQAKKKKKSLPYTKTPKLPPVIISQSDEVQNAFTLCIDTITDFDAMPDDAEFSDPVLFASIENAFQESQTGLYAAIDAQCAHVVARTLLLDRERRKKADKKRKSIAHNDKYSAVLNNFGHACYRLYTAEAEGGEDRTNESPEEKAAHADLWKAERKLDKFIHRYYTGD